MALNVIAISDLPSMSSVSDSDYLIMSSNGIPKKIEMDLFKETLGAVGGSIIYRTFTIGPEDLIEQPLEMLYPYYYEMTITGVLPTAYVETQLLLNGNDFTQPYAAEPLTNKVKIYFETAFTGTMTGAIYVIEPSDGSSGEE